MSRMLEIVDAIDDCRKHQCQTITVARCRECPSFYEVYEDQEGKQMLVCIYPKEYPKEHER
jgi:hypothetical protein